MAPRDRASLTDSIDQAHSTNGSIFTHGESRRPLTDLGNAERLVDCFGAKLRYNRQLGWMAYDGRRWSVNAREAAVAAAKATIRTIVAEADGLGAKEADAVEKWARNSESRSHVLAMVELATSEPALWANVEDFDRDPLLVNCANGTLDLRDGARRDHDPADMLTHVTNASYRPDADCPKFREFLEVVQPDPVMRKFLQEAAGYSLSGMVTAHVLLFCYGTGANGKTTFLEALHHTFGDYAQQTPTATLMRRKAGDASNDVARLRGARFVVATESERDQALAEAAVKRLTGGDTISARFLFKEYFDFVPTHTLWLASNYRPRVSGTDDGIWRRLALVPWLVTVDHDQQDPGLLAALKDEADGILQWAVNGALVALADGLVIPDDVINATLAYRTEQDDLGEFIAERCVVRSEVWVANTDLYAAFAEWCKDAGERTVASNKAFTAEMIKRGFNRRRAEATGARRWDGIGLV